MPGFNREPGTLAYSNDVWIDHVDHCDMKLAVVGNFHNQRSMAALRVANGHRRGKLAVRAFKDLALRRPGQIARALAGRAEYRHFAANRWKVVARLLGVGARCDRRGVVRRRRRDAQNALIGLASGAGLSVRAPVARGPRRWYR